MTMHAGTLVLRYAPHYGWQVFDWIPRNLMFPHHAGVGIIRDVDDDASLLRITGSFIKTFRRCEFVKRPHKLMYWPSTHGQRALLPQIAMPTNEMLVRMLEDLQRDPLEAIA